MLVNFADGVGYLHGSCRASCCQLGSIRRLYCWNLCNRFSKLLFLPWVLIDPWLPAPCLDCWWFKSFSRILASERENFRDSLNYTNEVAINHSKQEARVNLMFQHYKQTLHFTDIYDGPSACVCLIWRCPELAPGHSQCQEWGAERHTVSISVEQPGQVLETFQSSGKKRKVMHYTDL